ncbi:UbiA family prenyltransferase [Streptomyces sp. NPDC001822]|uniref:UbiA family prenyltransferase n=1 Tax=Streptomyces sp. NPDC001822 TaxID=3364614 RepID=UPI003699832C
MRSDVGVGRYSRLTRVHAASAAAFVYPLGPLVGSGGDVPLALLVAVALIGVLGHTYGCTVNDLADLASDRLNPARRRSVLVSGAITVGAARGALAVQLCAAAVLTAGALTAGDGARWPWILGVAALFGSITLSNIYQKRRIAHPLAMDALFGVNMGVPALLCCTVAASEDLAPAALVALAFGLHMALLNIVAGNLKDLEHDRSVGDDTTALRLGVRVTEGRHVLATVPYTVLVHLVLAASAAALLALATTAPAPGWQRAVAAVVVVALQAVAACSVGNLLRRRRTVDPRGRELYLGLNFFSLMASAFLWAPAGVITVTLLTAAWLPMTRRLVTMPADEQERAA